MVRHLTRPHPQSTMSADDTPTHIFEWTPPSAGVPRPVLGTDSLAEAVAPLADDRGATADDLVRRVARATRDWLQGDASPDAGIHARLQHELADVLDVHGWRAPVMNLRAALARIAARVLDDGGPALREALADECERWTAEGEGAPLGDKTRCAAPLLEGLEAMGPGETVLLHGWSETVARAVEFVQARGLRPSVIVSEGGPDLGGRRLARRLVASGVATRFVYDAALVAAVGRVDRVWLGTEAIGETEFVGRIGTRALLERARDLDVPAVLMATRAKFAPGSLALPEWPASEAWHLWEGAPTDVVVESQSYEEVPLDLVGAIATEAGLVGPLQRAAALS